MFDVPDYVINHGVVNISTLMSLFQSSKVNNTLIHLRTLSFTLVHD